MKKSKLEDLKKSKVKDFVLESKENIMEGVKEVSEFYDKMEPKVNEFFKESVKPTAENIYKSGSETFEQVVQKIQEVIEDLKNDLEVRSLTQKRNRLACDLGMEVYYEFMKKGAISKKFLESEKISKFVNQIHEKEENILKVGAKIEEE